MSTKWLLDRLAGRAVERAFGEPFLYVPRVAGRNAAPVLDPDRPQTVSLGVFSEAPEDEALFKERHAGANALGQSRVARSGTWLTLSAATVSSLGFSPKQGDAVLLTSRTSQPRYRVTQVHADDLGAMTLHLTREASS